MFGIPSGLIGASTGAEGVGQEEQSSRSLYIRNSSTNSDVG